MKKIVVSLLSQLLVVFSIYGQKNKSDYYMPAEWEPQSAVWMGWQGKPIRDSISAQIIEAISKDEQIKMVYREETTKFKGNRFLAKFNIDTSKIIWVKG